MIVSDELISVVVGTFGDRRRWDPLAQRALASVANQTIGPADVQRVHADTLHDARNKGAHDATGAWLCFLDADDELDPRYLEAMTTAFRPGDWLLQPATLGVVDGIEDEAPVVIPTRKLKVGNYLVIGTLVRRSHFLRAGGFYDWTAWEDWCLWLRCAHIGDGVDQVPDAIYRVHIAPGGRNSTAENDRRLHSNILRRHRQWLSQQ